MSDTPVTAPAAADDAPDQPISTADFQADPEPASEASDKQEAAEAVVESGGPASEGDATSELDSLKAQIEALTNKLAEKEAAEKEAAEKAEKVAADTFARFISGDKDSWAEQIAALTTLREQASPAPAPSIPRDPAVDADLETEDEGLTEALSFFGISN